MKVWGLTEAQLNATTIPGVVVNVGNKNGLAYNVKLSLPYDNNRELYRRTSASYFNPDRKVAAVCWHGHRDWMRKVFEVNSSARIKSGLYGENDYKGSESFESKYIASGAAYIGPPITAGYPRLVDACICVESGCLN